VNSRQDVIRLLDKICAYYQRHEPSSPVPLLLNRARRLVDKNFMEILEDLAPEGLGQARQVGGIENE
jgi:type VI secretion system protein ImpA